MNGAPFSSVTSVVRRVLAVSLAAAFVVFATPVFAASTASNSTNPLCRFDTGCMSSAMCEKYGGELARCPELGDECARAGWGLCFPPQRVIPLTIAIGGKTSVVDIGEYIAVAYRFAVGAAAVVAALMLMVGGFRYLTAGSGGGVSAAKDRIKNALVGLGITVFAYLILATINPALISLVVPRVPMVPPKQFVECGEYEMGYQCGAPFGLKERSGAAAAAGKYEVVEVDDPEAVATCLGMSCTLAGGWDATEKCIRKGGSAPSGDIEPGTPVPPYQCVGCFRAGTACTGLGPNGDCCSGFCGTAGSEIAQATGRVGDVAGQLSANVRLTNDVLGTGGSCTNGDNGIECTIDDECYGGHCVDTVGIGGVCASGVESAPCNGDDDCNAGLVCTDGIIGLGRCVRPGKGSFCVDDGDCPGSKCLAPEKSALARGVGIATPGLAVGGLTQSADASGAKVCGGVQTSDFCTQDSQCGTNEICWRDLPDAFKAALPGSALGVCKPITPGTLCKDQGDCRKDGSDPTAYCCKTCLDGTGLSGFGLCTLPQGGAGCDADSDCQRSADPAMQRAICHDENISGVCSYPGVSGAPCVSDGSRDSCGNDASGKRLICATQRNSGVEVLRCVPPNPYK